MAKQSIITTKGLELLATSSKASGQYYWLGYYALAYVPNAWKSDQTELPECSPDGFQLSSLPKDKISYSMQELTANGDIIYNVFQGDLLGTGYHRGSDGSAGGNLFGLSMYDQNIKKHYRYVLDENGNNQLVTWEREDRNNQLGMLKGKSIYKGTDGYNISELPIPAPLYYYGRSGSKLSTSDYFPEVLDTEFSGASIYRSSVYKYGANLPMKFPLISSDYRGYLDIDGNDETASYNHNTSGDQFDSLELASSVIPNGDSRSWFCSYATEISDIGDKSAKYADVLWKVISISNYNRYHAPTNAFGHTLDSDLASRNMATTTKFFPISNYKVVNSMTGFTIDNEYREVATSLALTIDIDLSPSTKNNGFDETSFNYDENNNLTFFDKYSENTGDFAKTSTSFKFNRIGIYAVALNESPYTIRRTDDTELPGTVCDVQFSINPDVEPILFAVADFDTTIFMSDTGNGLHRFRGDIQINLDAAGTNAIALDSQLCRDSVIFYNLYQDDAQTWYQNQLIATASTQNAIMEFGLELTGLKSRINDLACCLNPNYDDKYSLKNHTHNNSLRNLVDSVIAIDGGLRGIDTLVEGVSSGIFGSSVYYTGIDAVVLGKNTYSTAANSFVIGRNSGISSGNILTSSTDEIINDSTKKNLSDLSIIIGSQNSKIHNVNTSGILCSVNSIIAGTGIVNANDLVIISNSSNSFIKNSSRSLITSSDVINTASLNYGFIANSSNITVSDSAYVALMSSANTTLNNVEKSIINAFNSTIFNTTKSNLCGTDLYVARSNNSFISGQTINVSGIDSNNANNIAVFSSEYIVVDTASLITVISSSHSNVNTSKYILSIGDNNNIAKSNNGTIIGNNNTIKGDDTSTLYGIVIIGDNVTVDTNIDQSLSSRNVFIHGQASTIRNTQLSSVLASWNVHINGLHFVTNQNNSIISTINSYINGNVGNSAIISTESALVENTVFNSAILGGKHNSLYVASNSVVIGGEYNAIKSNYSGQWLPANNAVILGGNYAIAEYYGEITHSNAGLLIPPTYDDNNELLKVAVRSSIDDKIYKYVGGNTPVTGYDNLFANTKHSIVMLSGIWDTWFGSLVTYDPNPGIITGRVDNCGGTITNDELVSMPSGDWKSRKILSLDGNNPIMVTDDGSWSSMVSNQISIDPGESISGTVKFMIHTAHVPLAGCDLGNGTRTNTGVVYYSLHSFGAHRDHNGKIIISDQLINESSASHGHVPLSRFGLSTIIRPWAELLNDAANAIEPNNSSSGYKTESKIEDALDYTEYHRMSDADNQPDRLNGGGTNTGVILFSIDMDVDSSDVKELFASRILYCTAVVDFVSTKAFIPNAR